MATDDCHQTYKALFAKGVTFLPEPAERPYGIEAVMRDDSGNIIGVVQPHEFGGGDAPASSQPVRPGRAAPRPMPGGRGPAARRRGR